MDSPCHCYAQLAPDEDIYPIEYRYAGREYSTYIVATSLEDAEARLRHIKAGAWLTDGAMEFVPLVPGAGPYVRALVWMRNWWGRRR